MGSHIDCYLDLSSPFSYMAFKYLLKNRSALASYDVTVEFHPIFMAGVIHGSGNNPPLSVPAKSAYMKLDITRAKQYHSMAEITVPSFYPRASLFPQRSLCYTKENYPFPTFEEAWLALFHCFWVEDIDVTLPEKLRQTLQRTGLFAAEEVETILKAAGDRQRKDKLLANTQKAIEQGAFGAPWMWVRNRKGEAEPFFGSDRFHFMWEFLGVPWRDIAIIPKQNQRRRSCE